MWSAIAACGASAPSRLDLVARIAAGEHAALEISGLADQAAEAGQILRETLAQATLAAEALALPGPR